MHNLHPCHNSHFVYEPDRQWQDWLKKEAVCQPQNVLPHPPDFYCLSSGASIQLSPLRRLPFGEHSHGLQISSQLLPIQRWRYADLLLGPPCPYPSNNVLFRFLPIQPKHCPQPVDPHRPLPMDKHRNSTLSEQYYILDHQNRVMMNLHLIPRLEPVYRPRKTWMKWRPGPLRRALMYCQSFTLLIFLSLFPKETMICKPNVIVLCDSHCCDDYLGSVVHMVTTPIFCDEYHHWGSATLGIQSSPLH